MKIQKRSILIIAVIILCTVSILSCSLLGKYEVRYEVTGSASSLYYFTPAGQQTESSPSTPWSYKFSTSDETQTINLGATSNYGTVYVYIYVDGSLAKSASESGGLTAISGTYKISDFLP